MNIMRAILLLIAAATLGNHAQAQGVDACYLEPNEADIAGDRIYLYLDTPLPGGAVETIEVDGQPCRFFPGSHPELTRIQIEVPPHAPGEAELNIIYADSTKQTLGLTYVDQPFNDDADDARPIRTRQRIGGDSTFARPEIISRRFLLECGTFTRAIYYKVTTGQRGILHAKLHWEGQPLKIFTLTDLCSEPAEGAGNIETLSVKLGDCSSIYLGVGVEADEVLGANTPGGRFVLETSFVGPTAPFLVNDEPSGAIEIAPGTRSYGPPVEYYCATPSVLPADFGPHGPDIWFKFTADIAGTVLAEACYPDPPICSAFRFGIYDSELNFLGSDCTTSPDPSTARLPVPAPGLYYLRVEPASHTLFTYVQFTLPLASAGNNGTTEVGQACEPEYLAIEGAPDEEGEGEGTASGEVEEGALEGIVEGGNEGSGEGETGEGAVEGITEGHNPEGSQEGNLDEGEGEIAGEGSTEGRDGLEGEGALDGEAQPLLHSADTDRDGRIDLPELLRVVQLRNAGSYHCEAGGEDGFSVGAGDTLCPHHAADYDPADWTISLTEVMRVVQVHNSDSYHPCKEGEDGYCI